MAYDEQIAQRFRRELTKLDAGAVYEKHMFGALGFMINGKLAVCVGDADVMYKLGFERCKKLIAQDVAEPVVMGKRTMKDWVNVDFYYIRDREPFKDYLLQALQYNANA